MAAPNIVNVTSIIGKTAVLAVTTTATNIVNNAAASSKVFKINNLIVSNIDGAAACDITASIFRSSVEYKIAHTVVVPADATLTILTKDTQIYLEEGDALRLTASANGDLSAICSYEEIS
jgi:Na+-translocating ferredoxin:NAD+ oxidoreductase RnfE subunit